MHKKLRINRGGLLHRVRRITQKPAFIYALLFVAASALTPFQAHASPFDSGITSIQTLFTSTIARAASLIAIVIGGYSFAHGDPGAKKTLGGVAAGTGIAVLAVNVLSWLWGA